MSNVQAEDLYEVFRLNMKRRRTELGLSQVDLSRMTGIAQPQISALESGKTNPNLATIAKIAEALDTTPSAMLSAVGLAVHS